MCVCVYMYNLCMGPQPLARQPASQGADPDASAVATWGGRTEHQAQLAQFDGLTLHVPPGAQPGAFFDGELGLCT